MKDGLSVLAVARYVLKKAALNGLYFHPDPFIVGGVVMIIANGAIQTEPEDGGPCVRTASRETIEAEILADSIPTLLLGERKIGSWRRTFTLPEDVMMKELKTRLEGGLLRITLPKRSAEDTELLRGGGVKIEIED